MLASCSLRGPSALDGVWWTRPGFTVEGGPLHVVCPLGSSPIDLDPSPGTFLCTDVRSKPALGWKGHLTVDWDGSVDCTGFVGDCDFDWSVHGDD